MFSRSATSASDITIGNLTVGGVAPNFEANTTTGSLKFYQWIRDSWVIVFRYPSRPTPTERDDITRRVQEFQKRNIKVVAVSTNSLDDHRKWAAEANNGSKSPIEGDFQIVVDKKINLLYQMHWQDEKGSGDIDQQNYTVFAINPKKSIRLVLLHPASMVHNFKEIIKYIDHEDHARIKEVSEQAPLRQEKSTTFSIASGLSKVIEPTWSNPYLQNAVQVLGQVAELGRTLPFLSPAFILLKVIVDTEKSAREVDVKCNDLLERITFMLSHLPTLRRIKTDNATRLVIDRMNDALKKAAALIEAYRKQGPIARRLSISNKEKFAACVEAISTCTKDLVIALQVQQSVKLDILSRAVPVDPEDEAAQTFVEDHGGIEVVKENKELVTQFAHQMHLSMDDKVMEQLNANITDAIHRKQAELERLINENVSAAVVEGIKGLAAQMTEAEKEQRFKCVQCDQEYRNSTNGPTSCSFHRAEYDSWSKSYPCCSTSHPCQFQSHRASHHCEYPYGTFFKHARNITNYVDTTDNWALVEDTNLENNETRKASVGRLLRWVSRGSILAEQTMLISVGTVWFSEPYYFNTFTAKDLEVLAKVIAITKQTTIFRTSPSESEFAMAEWVLSADRAVTGVRLTAKAATSDSPYIRVCPIDFATCTKSGDVLTLSEGGLRAYIPSEPYVLPETVRVGPELSDAPVRDIRTDFKTRTSANLPVVLKAASDPPLTANPQFANSQWDTFEGAISVFNKHAAGSASPITIASVSASFRLVGEESYTPVKSCTILDGTELPVTIDPRQSWTLRLQVAVPRTEEDVRLDVRWWNRAFVSRKRPLRLKVVLEDIEGEEASLVLEHIYKPYPLEKAKENDIAFLSFDNADLCERYSIRVEPPSNKNGVLRIDGEEIDAKRLTMTVYKAIKSGESEVDFLTRERASGQWEWKAWALVDLSCRRVYAFKILLREKNLAPRKGSYCLGYVSCPDYGEGVNETRPIRYAQETAKAPDAEPHPVEELVTDDALDDYVPEPVKPPPASADAGASGSGGGGGVIGLSEDVKAQMTSLDNNLSRIATALEQLVDILSAKK